MPIYLRTGLVPEYLRALRMPGYTCRLVLLLLPACELKENEQPVVNVDTMVEPLLPRVDTVYQVDTVTRTRVETVFVVDTIREVAPGRASIAAKGTTKSATKTGSISPSKAATKTGSTSPSKAGSKVGSTAAPPVVVKKPVAVTKAPVDTRTLPAASTKPGTVNATTVTTSAVSRSDLDYLRSRKLLVPVSGFPFARIPDHFLEKRGSRQHSALDFLAPKGTPVVSTDAGIVAKVHTSKGGGLTLYVADPREVFIYYYAHLDRYKPGIKEGDRVAAGDVIGYVGSTGNATASAPHLHFAIGKMDAEQRWWKTTAIDPKPLLARAAPAR